MSMRAHSLPAPFALVYDADGEAPILHVKSRGLAGIVIVADLRNRLIQAK
jgi:hypothetical protein